MIISNTVQMFKYWLKHLVKSKNSENIKKGMTTCKAQERVLAADRLSEAFCDVVLALSGRDI